MKLIIDDAHIDRIKRVYEFYPVDGVTTNPTILAESGRAPYDVLKEIRRFIGDGAQLHVQAVSRDAKGMVEEARRITSELGGNTFVKVPSLPEGFKAKASRRRYFDYRYGCLYADAGFPGSQMRCILCGPLY